jgi:hypothetical protein
MATTAEATAGEPGQGGESKNLEAALDRANWRESPERKRTIFMGWGILASCILLTILGAFIGKEIAWGYQNPILYALYGAGATFVGAGYIGFVVFFTYRAMQRRAVRDRRVVGEAKIELDKAEADLGDESHTDFGTLWKVTQKRLDYYHKIATSHAERSFLYGQVAAGIGFLVLVVCAVAAAFAQSTAASVSAGLLGVAGGGLGGYIGTTFMRSQETATEQLRAYFSQPLEFSKFLAAERLLNSLDDNSRTAATTYIIEAIASSPDALKANGQSESISSSRKPARNRSKSTETSN